MAAKTGWLCSTPGIHRVNRRGWCTPAAATTSGPAHLRVDLRPREDESTGARRRGWITGPQLHRLGRSAVRHHRHDEGAPRPRNRWRLGVIEKHKVSLILYRSTAIRAFMKSAARCPITTTWAVAPFLGTRGANRQTPKPGSWYSGGDRTWRAARSSYTWWQTERPASGYDQPLAAATHQAGVPTLPLPASPPMCRQRGRSSRRDEGGYWAVRFPTPGRK